MENSHQSAIMSKLTTIKKLQLESLIDGKTDVEKLHYFVSLIANLTSTNDHNCHLKCRNAHDCSVMKLDHENFFLVTYMYI